MSLQTKFYVLEKVAPKLFGGDFIQMSLVWMDLEQSVSLEEDEREGSYHENLDIPFLDLLAELRSLAMDMDAADALEYLQWEGPFPSFELPGLTGYQDAYHTAPTEFLSGWKKDSLRTILYLGID